MEQITIHDKEKIKILLHGIYVYRKSRGCDLSYREKKLIKEILKLPYRDALHIISSARFYEKSGFGDIYAKALRRAKNIHRTLTQVRSATNPYRPLFLTYYN